MHEHERREVKARLRRNVVAAIVLIVACRLAWAAPAGRPTPKDFPTLVVDPNRVPLPVLGALPGIGEARLKAIDAQRRSRPFASADDVDRRVRGIGPATIAELRPHFRFDTPNP